MERGIDRLIGSVATVMQFLYISALKKKEQSSQFTDQSVSVSTSMYKNFGS